MGEHPYAEARRRYRLARPGALCLAALGATMAVIAGPMASGSTVGAGTTIRVSVNSAGVEGNSDSGGQLAVDADAQVVAFQSNATNLVPGDTNGVSDVFVRDRTAGTTERVSVTSAGAQANGASSTPAVSADGRIVAFVSTADNLIPGDTNGKADVFVHDRVTGITERVNVTNAGGDLSLFDASAPSLSGDGGLVAFSDGGVYVRDRQAHTTQRVDVNSAGTPGTVAGQNASITPDGRFVSFNSTATNLVAGDTNAKADVFVRDRQAGTTERVSVNSTGAQANNTSMAADISADGNVVAFTSTATNLVPGDTNGLNDVFVRDRQAGTTERVNLDSSGAQAVVVGLITRVSMSDDGRRVAFGTTAKLVPTDNNPATDVYVRDRQSATTTEASVSSTGAQGIGESGGWVDISGDGTAVAFVSYAPNLVPDDRNDVSDVFLHALGPPTTARQAVADFDGNGSTDVSVYRPSSSQWFVSGASATATTFGASGDIPVPGDFSGTKSSDVAVFRPSTGTWFIQGGIASNFGTNGDLPVPGSYGGGSTLDFAVFRPTTGAWFVQGGASTTWGINGDVPVPGDYDGDGKTDVAVFRPSQGVWYVHQSSGTDIAVAYGANGDVPVPGDYDGDGKTDLAVFRPSQGAWYVHNSSGVADTVLIYGTNGDVPVPGDYDGDGKTDLAVFRPSQEVWYVHNSSGVDTAAAFGTTGDIPLPLPAAIRLAFFSSP